MVNVPADLSYTSDHEYVKNTDDPNVVQVATNLLDTTITPLDIVFEAIRSLAADAGVAVLESEIVGLVPVSVLAATTARYISAPALGPRHAGGGRHA